MPAHPDLRRPFHVIKLATQALDELLIRNALTLDTHREYVANAIVLGLSNARLEGTNSMVRLISHRARGFRRLDSLLALLTLVCRRIPIELPT